MRALHKQHSAMTGLCEATRWANSDHAYNCVGVVALQHNWLSLGRVLVTGC